MTCLGKCVTLQGLCCCSFADMPGLAAAVMPGLVAVKVVSTQTTLDFDYSVAKFTECHVSIM